MMPIINQYLFELKSMFYIHDYVCVDSNEHFTNLLHLLKKTFDRKHIFLTPSLTLTLTLTINLTLNQNKVFRRQNDVIF